MELKNAGRVNLTGKITYLEYDEKVRSGGRSKPIFGAVRLGKVCVQDRVGKCMTESALFLELLTTVCCAVSIPPRITCDVSHLPGSYAKKK